MTSLEKKAFKGLTTGIKVRKPRYYYQDIVEVYNEDTIKNIELTKFEGLEYNVNQRVIRFKEKTLWNNTISPYIMRILAPYNDEKYLALARFVNYNIVGSPDIKEGVASGFSSSDYILVPEPFNPKAKTWEIVIKCTTSDSFVNESYLYGNKSTNRSTPQLATSATGNIKIYMASTTGSWNIADNVLSENVLEVNTTYYIKTSFDGANYIVSVRKDGESEWVEFINIASTLTIYGTDQLELAIGMDSGNQPWNGSIDLNECHIIVGSAILWGKDANNIFELKGCLLEDGSRLSAYNTAFCGGGEVLLSSSDNDREGYAWGGKIDFPPELPFYKAYKINYNIVGKMLYSCINRYDYDSSLSDAYITGYKARGFDASNYIEIPAMKNYNSYEMVFRGGIYNQTGGHLVWGDNTSSFFIQTNSKKLSISKGSTYVGTNVIPIDTIYEFKLVWDGTNSTWYSRVAVPYGALENPWVLEGTKNIDLFDGANVLRIGGPSTSTSYYWKGDIDLLNSYIKVDDEYYWKPLTEV